MFHKGCGLGIITGLLILMPFVGVRSQRPPASMGILYNVLQIFHLATAEACKCSADEECEPSGPAGGALTGTFPDPTLDDNVVGTEQVIDASLTAADLGPDSVGTTELVNTTVTPGPYGSPTEVGTFTVDADGRLTAAANVTITGAAPSGAAGGVLAGTFPDPTLVAGSVGAPELAATAVTPATYGTATAVATVTFDADGRATSAANTPITVAVANALVDDELPTPCVLHTRIILTPGVVEYFCHQDAVGEIAENKRCIDDDTCWVPLQIVDTAENTTSGIQTTPTEVTSIRFQALQIAEADPCNLGPRTLVNVLAGTNGKTCFLPDPTLTATVGHFRVYVEDANYLTLAPTSGALINGAATALPAIRGPGAYYEIWRVKSTEWKVTSVAGIGYGEPLATICAKFGGSTNTSTTGSGAYVDHTLTCAIPAGKLRTGTVIEMCNGLQYSTGTTAPATVKWQVSAGSTVLNNQSSGIPLTSSNTNRNGEFCVDIIVGAPASATTPLYTMPRIPWGHLNTTTSRGIVAQPVNVDGLVDVVLTLSTQWSDAGSGGASTMTQQFMITKASGLGD